MTTELTQPPSDAGQAQASAPGQSQEHRRRRRRRRKTKSNPAAQNQPQNQNGQQASASPAPPPVQQNQPRPQQQSGQQQGSSGSGRKKKKKHGGGGGGFQASPGNNANPGNSINGHSGGKKRQQKGPRQFVGPMDHSYRVVNGNVADSPPSTIPLHGNGNSGGYYSDLQNVRVTAPQVVTDAPPRIYFFIEDLFFLAKIQEVSRKIGVKVEFVKGDGKDAVTRITEAPENERPGLLVFDLNNNALKPLTLIPKIRAKLKKSVSIIGFLSHLQGDLKLKATEAGCDTVMPRSAFSQSLPNLIMRYGLDEEEDNYPQPV